eukprot:SAG31_NODE_7873_length_1576_cov_7.134056_2_plen_295_part_00
MDQSYPNLIATSMGHLTSHDVYESWGVTITDTTTVTASVEGYVRFGTLVNRLSSRCEWAGYFGTCAYSYPLALEAALLPGEVLDYNCTMTADRSDCSDECGDLLGQAYNDCGPDDTYLNGQGILASYEAMMYVLDLHYSCQHGSGFECTPQSLGRAFCETLHEVASTSIGYMVQGGCGMTMSTIGTIMPVIAGFFEMPYRATACLAELGAAPETESIVVQDVCYCSDNQCPGDSRDPAASNCTLGYHPPPPPPAPDAPQPEPSPPPPTTSSGKSAVVFTTAAVSLLICFANLVL